MRLTLSEGFITSLRPAKAKLRPNKPRSPHFDGNVERTQQVDMVEFYALEIAGKGKHRRAIRREGLEQRQAECQAFNNGERAHGRIGGKTPWQRWQEVAALTPSREEIEARYDERREPTRIQRGNRRWVPSTRE